MATKAAVNKRATATSSKLAEVAVAAVRDAADVTVAVATKPRSEAKRSRKKTKEEVDDSGVAAMVQEEDDGIDDGGFILGIDEAGRGPVLGPMVYGACWCPRVKRHLLAKLGFADSKALTAAERDRLFELIKNTDWIGWAVDIISPQDMSSKMLRRNKYSLNAISHDSAIGLIRKALALDVKVTEVYVDTVGPPEKYQDMLSNLFPNIKFTVSKKADSLFPVVSAASICAKVTRDQCLEEWQFIEAKQGMHISTKTGSGYPGDEHTQAWLKDHFNPLFGWPSLVRFSWATCKKITDEHGIKVIWDDDEDDAGRPLIQPGMQTLSSFFAPALAPSSSPTGTAKTVAARAQIPLGTRAPYFQTRHMNIATSF